MTDAIRFHQIPSDSIRSIANWHQQARPAPSDKDFNVQLGCHLEEIAEMVETLKFCTEGWEPTPGELTLLYSGLKLFADNLKRGAAVAVIRDREAFLDSLADQIVTAVGVGHCADMNVKEATARVDSSNWSKFVDGKPQFDENGKIAKPTTYRKPDLTGCL